MIIYVARLWNRNLPCKTTSLLSQPAKIPNLQRFRTELFKVKVQTVKREYLSHNLHLKAKVQFCCMIIKSQLANASSEICRVKISMQEMESARRLQHGDVLDENLSHVKVVAWYFTNVSTITLMLNRSCDLQQDWATLCGTQSCRVWTYLQTLVGHIIIGQHIESDWPYCSMVPLRQADLH